jgi:hypothetical protein
VLEQLLLEILTNPLLDDDVVAIHLHVHLVLLRVPESVQDVVVEGNHVLRPSPMEVGM